ncbi:Keratin associated protein 18-4 [Minicystis rosea]|nr:Keratin associated protein 18-4 [Minicystis rosea]
MRSISRLVVGLFAAPLMLVSSAAMAAPSAAACDNIELAANGSCDYEVSGGCEADCTPLNFVAACDGKCSASAEIDCTGGCQASCEADCTVDPGGFDCEGSCSATCKASCDGNCNDSDCSAQCEASCGHRCNIQCTATPPSATCTAKCKASCDASCTVQANLDCSVQCSADLEGGCKVKCSEPQGALFCDGQYVDVVGNTQDCIDYLTSRGLNVGASADCTVTAGGSDCSLSVGCSAAPYLASEKTGVGAIAGLMLGLGMVVTRRRRRAS